MQLTNWYTYVTLFCFLITAGFWVIRLNKVRLMHLQSETFGQAAGI